MDPFYVALVTFAVIFIAVPLVIHYTMRHDDESRGKRH